MRTVTAYTEEFYRLASWCDLSLTEEQQAAKYIHGLKYPIQERVVFQNLYSVDEAENKAMKVKRLQNNALSFKNSAERTFNDTRTQQGSTSNKQPPVRKASDAPPANPATTSTPSIKGKENPYASLG